MDPLVTEKKLQELQKKYPKWFHYSDTLGERPIDGLIREVHFNSIHTDLSNAARSKQQMQHEQRDQTYSATPEAKEYQEEQINTGRLPQGPMM